MKLFQRYTRISLLLTLAVLLLGIGVLFGAFRYILMQQVDESLELEQEEIMAHIKQYNTPPNPVNVSDLKIRFLPADSATETVYQSVEVAEEDFRELAFSTPFGGKNYRFTIQLPLEQTETLLRIIVGVTLGMLLLITLSIYALNRRLVRQLIAPFHHTLSALNTYSALQKEPLQLPPTPIEEFTLLNHSLNAMTGRMQRDVAAVRRFTAQAAHELQTPLAVMRNQLEALLQAEELTATQAAGMGALEESVAKMSRLFRSLLLLTRIESRQFEEAETVDLKALLEDLLLSQEDLILSKNTMLQLSVLPAETCCNPYLAEVLVRNLLLNALRYTPPAGLVEIKLVSRQFQISNTSELDGIPAEDLFRPFYRNPGSGQSGTGLGLPIAAQIAERYGWKLEYHFAGGQHCFTLLFF